MLKKILIALLIAFVVIQFIRPARNRSEAAQPHDIAAVYPVPEDVQDVLKRACYDCHSNHTRYPWYTHVQPVGWWMERHIDEGKSELNFSEFAGYKKKRKVKKLGQVADAVSEGWMPLSSYTAVHRDAILKKEEIAAVAAWAEGLAAHIDSTED